MKKQRSKKGDHVGTPKSRILKNVEVWEKYEDLLRPAEGQPRGDVIIVQKTKTRNGNIRLWMVQAVERKPALSDASKVFGTSTASSNVPKLLRYDYTVPASVAQKFPIGQPVTADGQETHISVLIRTAPWGFRSDNGLPERPMQVKKGSQMHLLVILTEEGYKPLYYTTVLTIGEVRNEGEDLVRHAINVSVDSERGQEILSSMGHTDMVDGGEDVIGL